MAEKPEDDEALRSRLARLSQLLDAQEAPERAKADVAGDTAMSGAISLGARVLTEFVAGVAVGALIGWQLDVWLKTLPLFLIVFLTLGTAAGFWNVYRIAAKPIQRGPRP